MSARGVFLLALLLCCGGPILAFQNPDKNGPRAGVAEHNQSGGASLQPTSAESELYNLVNEERKSRNLPTFAFDGHLIAAAREHTKAMAHAGKLSHQFSDEPELKTRLAEAGARFDAAAENVAQSDSVQDAHIELMHSPGHRANLLNPIYNAVGIAVVEMRQRIYVTEDFSRRVADQTVQDVENQIFKKVNQLRSGHGLAALQRADASSLRQLACKTGLTAADARRYLAPGGFIVVFTQSDAGDPPNDLKKLAVSPVVSTIAIGACYPPESKEGFAMFTAVAVLSK